MHKSELLGYFVGEGCLGIYIRKAGTSHYDLQVGYRTEVQSTDHGFINEFSKVYGGKTSHPRRNKPNIGRWALQDRAKIEIFLKDLSEMNIPNAKQKQAVLMLKALSIETPLISKEDAIEIANLSLQVSNLNKKGKKMRTLDEWKSIINGAEEPQLKQWSKAEIELLCISYPVKNKKALSQLFPLRSGKAIGMKAVHLHLKKAQT